MPFTNEQIARVLEDLASEFEAKHGSSRISCFYRERAAKLRTENSRPSRWDIAQAGHVLVKVCFCGKVALYRYGLEGRCRRHKTSRPEFSLAKDRAMEQKAASIRKDWCGRKFYKRHAVIGIKGRV